MVKGSSCLAAAAPVLRRWEARLASWWKVSLQQRDFQKLQELCEKQDTSCRPLQRSLTGCKGGTVWPSPMHSTSDYGLREWDVHVTLTGISQPSRAKSKLSERPHGPGKQCMSASFVMLQLSPQISFGQRNIVEYLLKQQKEIVCVLLSC